MSVWSVPSRWAPDASPFTTILQAQEASAAAQTAQAWAAVEQENAALANAAPGPGELLRGNKFSP